VTTARYRLLDLLTAPGAGLLSTCVADVLDGFTIRRLAQVGVAESFRCLVIGAGTDTIAGWLAERVGDDGEVVVTDADPGRVPAQPGVTVLRHDLATDPLVKDDFDLIHVRSVLACLPGRREVLVKLAAALAPGGAIAFDELEPARERCLLDSPDPAARRLFDRYHDALAAVLASTGVGPSGRPTHQVMVDIGLADVDTEVWARSWRGGEPGCLLLHTFAGQLRDQLIASGRAGSEIDDLRALLVDPRVVIRGCLAVSTIGRKPPPPPPPSERPCRCRGSGRVSPVLGRSERPHPSRP
jgi:hypothetical protein